MYDARVFRILIASPSDVDEERELAVQCIQEWNNLNSHDRKVVLMPLRWETHTRPEYGKRPQEIINRTVVDYCDMMIGIFWTRIGSDAGDGRTGTVEEIERVVADNKPVMLYFSKAKIEPERIDIEQLTALNEFKSKTYKNALVEQYTTAADLRERLARHLERSVRELMTGKADQVESSGRLVTDVNLLLVDPSSDTETDSLELSGEMVHMERLGDVDVMAQEVFLSLPADDREAFQRWAGRRGIREFVIGEFQRRLLRPIQFSLENVGIVGIRDVYVELTISTQEVPFYFVEPDMIADSSPHSWSMRTPIDTKRVLSQGLTWTTVLEMNAIQPKRKMRSNVIGYVGAPTSTPISIHALIYGDCLSQPLKKQLTVQFESSLPKVDIMLLAQERINDVRQRLEKKVR